MKGTALGILFSDEFLYVSFVTSAIIHVVLVHVLLVLL